MLDIYEFEYVPAGGDLALVRLAGVWTDGAAPPGCRLLVEIEGAEEWFEPLPQKWGDDVWRAAWTAPVGIVTAPVARYVLVPPSDERVELPHPIEHGMAAHEIAAVRVEAEHEIAAVRAEAEQEIAAARAELEGERARAEELEGTVAKLRARIEAGDERLGEIERRAEALRSAIRASTAA